MTQCPSLWPSLPLARPIPTVLKALAKLSKGLLTSYHLEAGAQTAPGGPGSSPSDGMVSGQISRAEFD